MSAHNYKVKIMALVTASHDVAIYSDKLLKSAHFASLDAFCEYNGVEHSNCMTKSNAWTEYASGKKMIELIQSRNMPKKIMERLNGAVELTGLDCLTVEAPQQTVTLSEAGFMPDMNAYYSGEDEYMINMETVTTQSRTIWLASSIISSGGVTAEAMTNRGVALIRAVKTLQTAGYSVGLVAYLYGNAGSNTLVNVVVKTPDEPLNETLVAAAFAHPSFFRTLGHNVVAKLNGCNGGMNSLKKPPSDLFKDSFINSEQLVILDGCFEYKDCETPYRAEKWIINEIETAIEQRNNA
jgi:hypothetical protein